MSEIAIPQQPQRNPISRLWNDKETRSVIIQIIAFAGIFAFFFFLVRNAIVNLEAIGKDISLEFLLSCQRNVYPGVSISVITYRPPFISLCLYLCVLTGLKGGAAVAQSVERWTFDWKVPY